MCKSETQTIRTLDSYLKGVSIDGVEVYFDDDQGTMSGAEASYLSQSSMVFLMFSILFVLFCKRAFILFPCLFFFHDIKLNGLFPHNSCAVTLPLRSFAYA